MKNIIEKFKDKKVISITTVSIMVFAIGIFMAINSTNGSLATSISDYHCANSGWSVFIGSHDEAKCCPDGFNLNSNGECTKAAATGGNGVYCNIGELSGSNCVIGSKAAIKNACWKHYDTYVWVDSAEGQCNSGLGGINCDLMTAYTTEVSCLAQNKYTVTFDSNGGTPTPASQTISSGGTATEPSNPSKDGYKFGCWSKSKSSQDCFNFSTAINNNITLYAWWIRDNSQLPDEYYTVTFDSKGGTPTPTSVTVKEGEKVSKPSQDPNKTGYAFRCWTTDSNATSSSTCVTFPKEVNQDLKLYATYTVNSGGGTPSNPDNPSDPETPSTPKVTIKFKANGGTIKSAATTSGLSYTVVNDDIYSNGSQYVVKVGNDSYVNEEDGLINYDNPAYLNLKKTGYSGAVVGEEWICLSGACKGRTYNQAGSGKYKGRDFCDASSSNCEVTLGVNWATVTLIFKANGGSIASAATTEGYSYTVDNDIIYKNGDQYIIKRGNEQYIDEASGLIDYNNKAFLNLKKDGSTGAVLGEEWKCLSGNCKQSTYSQSGDPKYTGSSFCDASKKSCEVTLGVNWLGSEEVQKHVVTIKFKVDKNNGEVVTEKTNGGTWTVGEDGYLYRNDGETSGMYVWKLYNDATVNKNNGLVNYNSPDQLNIAKDGYIAVANAEWKCIAGECKGKTYSQVATNPLYKGSDFCDASSKDCEVTLGVNWTKSKYKVYFDLNGGTGKIGAQDVEHGAAVTKPSTVPTLKGYKFSHWSTSKNGKEYDFSTKVTESITLYANYVDSNGNVVEDVSSNPTTGGALIALVWIMGLGALGYTVYYFKKEDII